MQATADAWHCASGQQQPRSGLCSHGGEVLAEFWSFLTSECTESNSHKRLADSLQQLGRKLLPTFRLCRAAKMSSSSASSVKTPTEVTKRSRPFSAWSRHVHETSSSIHVSAGE